MEIKDFHILSIILLSIFHPNASEASRNCTTPENARGNCLALVECPHIYTIMNNRRLTNRDVSYLRQSQCGYNNREEDFAKKVLVCCPQYQSTEIKRDVLPRTVNNARFIKNNIEDNTASSRVQHNATNSITYANCTTPENSIGICLALTDCPYLQELVTSRELTNNDILYLRQFQCGLNNDETTLGKRVLVCCSQKHLKTQTAYQLAHRGDILPDISECGFFMINKIYGGNMTEIGEFPWMAMIEYKNRANFSDRKHHCGGNLINSRYVLTAAHCINGPVWQTKWELSGVRLGEWDTNTNPDCYIYPNGYKDCAASHRDVNIEQTIVHEQYDPNSKNQHDDIALIRLTESITYGITVRPICLPLIAKFRYSQFKNFNMEIAGWGKTEHTFASHVKLKATVNIWPLDDCQMQYHSIQRTIGETQLCAGGVKGIDSCIGDSGGPLMLQEQIKNKKLHFLAGIVSSGLNPCGSAGWPAIYTRVGSYMDWIITNIRI